MDRGLIGWEGGYDSRGEKPEPKQGTPLGFAADALRLFRGSVGPAELGGAMGCSRPEALRLLGELADAGLLIRPVVGLDQRLGRYGIAHQPDDDALAANIAAGDRPIDDALSA